MAERVGFEPTVPLTVHKLSKPAPNANSKMFLNSQNRCTIASIVWGNNEKKDCKKVKKKEQKKKKS